MKKIFTLLLVATLLLAMTGCIEPEYTITKELNGGTDIVGDIEDPDNIEVLDVPLKEGYTFEGWYLESTFENEFDEETPLEEDITIYAKWEEITYTISYVITGDTNHTIDDEIIAYSDTYTLPVINMEGYEFTGWFTDEDLETSAISENPMEDITFYGKLTEIVVNVDSYKIAMITDSSPVDDGAFMENTYRGIEIFAENNNLTYNYYVPLSYSLDGHMDAIELAIEYGAEFIICPGWLFENAVHKASFMYPDVKFLLIDGTPHNIVNWAEMSTYDGSEPNYDHNSNAMSILFKEHEAGFLAGYAAVKDGNTSLGFLGGLPVPAIVKYGTGFVAGAYYAAEELGIEITFDDSTFGYVNGFHASNEALSMATNMYQSGVDVIFTVAGGGTMSVIQAAENQEKWVICADFNYYSASPYVLTSAIKNFDIAAYGALQSHYVTENFTSGNLVLGVNELGVSLTYDRSRFETIDIEDLGSVLLSVADGTIVVPSTFEELQIFLGDDASNFTEEGMNS